MRADINIANTAVEEINLKAFPPCIVWFRFVSLQLNSDVVSIQKYRHTRHTRCIDEEYSHGLKVVYMQSRYGHVYQPSQKIG